MSANHFDPKTKCILILEDDELSGRLLQAILVKEGFQVLTCSQGSEALELLQQPKTHVDLIITDIIMPVMGGFDFLDHLKNESKSKPFMVITSLKDKSTMDKAKDRGVVDYILKPFKTSDVLSRLRRFFDGVHNLSA
jgi:sigma-B regulation protein RsbU (phosphoserine phosphatase)